MPDASNLPPIAQKEFVGHLADSEHHPFMHSPARLCVRSVLALGLICIAGLGCQHAPPASSLAPPDSSRWEQDIQRFEEADRTSPPPRNGILFVGSSSIRLWRTLAQDFLGKPVFNRGFGGSQLADSVNFADRIIIPYAPKQVVIYAGVNDLHAGKSADAVYGDFVALVSKIHRELPKAKVLFIALSTNPSRWAEVEQVREVNRRAADYCRQRDWITFVDTFSLMLDAEGRPLPDIFVADKLHMNSKGYAIWREVIAPHLLD